MTKIEKVRVLIERARISQGDNMDRAALVHLIEAVDALAGYVDLRPEKAGSAAPTCMRCANDEHDKCGGPESGCGCAAENHGEPIVLKPADPPPPKRPPMVTFNAISKGELCGQIAKVTGRLQSEVEIDFRSFLDVIGAAVRYGDMASLCKLVDRALRLAGVIR